jgi:hypothetical protein
MAEATLDPLAHERLERLETTVARLRYVAIALLVAMIAGFSVIGLQVRRLDGRIERLAAKVDGIDTTLGVRFEETNAKLDTSSQRLAVELKTMGAQIEAQTSAIAKSTAAATGAPPSPVPVPPKPAPTQPPRGRP